MEYTTSYVANAYPICNMKGFENLAKGDCFFNISKGKKSSLNVVISPKRIHLLDIKVDHVNSMILYQSLEKEKIAPFLVERYPVFGDLKFRMTVEILPIYRTIPKLEVGDYLFPFSSHLTIVSNGDMCKFMELRNSSEYSNNIHTVTHITVKPSVDIPFEFYGVFGYLSNLVYLCAANTNILFREGAYLCNLTYIDISNTSVVALPGLFYLKAYDNLTHLIGVNSGIKRCPPFKNLKKVILI